MKTIRLNTFLPFLSWTKNYSKETFICDSIAALVVSMMLIPQSLAYATLAGLPPQAGLYASLLPLLAYALLGSSGPLSVGPFAITSIMTATALAALFTQAHYSPEQMLIAASILALLSGSFLLAFGVFRFGFLTNFISFPVITGFISASAIIIASSQLGNILGLSIHSDNFFHTLESVIQQFDNIHAITLLLSAFLVLFLYAMPKLLRAVIYKISKHDLLADSLSKITPVLAIILSSFSVYAFDLTQYGISIVGDIPAGLPSISIPNWQALELDQQDWEGLLNSALLISIIGFISSLSAAQTFAAKQRQRINPNQEAIALGVANLSAGLSSAFPVSASLSRSAVSFNAGAKTPAASALTAIGIFLCCLFLTPYLYYLPIVTLAAMILLAVISLFDLAAIKRTFSYSLKDFSALVITFVLTLTQGLEWGLIVGIAVSIALHLHRSSSPHVAILGLVPNTEHFRNIERHSVITNNAILSLRIDASLYFANARFLEDKINQLVAQSPEAKHIILTCSAINDIDASAVESLIAVNQYLKEAGIEFHLSEVKGPVMDRLKHSEFIDKLTGKIYLSHHQAWSDLVSKD
ncbi:MAG: sulfate permease [Oleispira antarctica]|uniref:Sulfate transporter n=1 Tax=Oleispira antarctica RB-8 TaxID=698738 RepID=R4YQI5_OLEAN|nr:sulfate permease [Oleispira antarctica]MBQ0793054.1 sulfate permease [Oleispira antarctica]CCK77210.1 Sulfate transporter [Oleispira antarctica RB-8]